MKFYLLFLYFTFLSVLFTDVTAQNIIDNQILVNFHYQVKNETLEALLKRNFNIGGEILITDLCMEPVIVKKIEFDPGNNNTETIIEFLKKRDFVASAQFNHFVESRNTPNDSLFKQQWFLNNTGQSGGTANADIDADLAWDLTTGGTTKNGDTIVICVVDNGMDLTHIDIVNNLWTNYGEIPDNGIDDDQNSYIDDYRGWNGEDQNGNIPAGNHGTSVAGLIGAQGNNKKGIAGINWNIKILPVFKGNDEAHMLSAYAYAYNLRKRYNESNGTKGAFIVATNSSFGTDFAKAEDHPIWCSMYDSLGSVGILNIVATANSNTNVDVLGDMPSTCPGDYMISVTNVDHQNNKVNGAGFGPVHIDIGGYGANVLTIRKNNLYTSFSGTSAATPVVAGVVGLIYAYSERIAAIAITNPQLAALMAKDAILEGSKPLNSLKNITVTGGVVNAYNSLKNIGKYDDDCAPPYLVNIDTVGADIIGLSWENLDSSSFNLAYRTAGQEWKTIENIKSPYKLENLGYCSSYELKIQEKCGDSLSPFGYTLNVSTLGCCTSPEINDHYILNNNLHVSWDKNFVAQKYYFIYKFWSEPIWDTIITENNFVDIDYTNDCGMVSVYLRSECNDTLSTGNQSFILGENCPECSLKEYCLPSIDNDLEWITKIRIDDFANESGKNYDGIGIFTNSPALKLIQNETYKLTAEIEFSDIKYSDSLFLWVDLDNNGVFGAKELLGRVANNKTNEANIVFKVPEISFSGNSRMRVMLSAYSISNPCEIAGNDYGEYEDYCVFLDTVKHCQIPGLNINHSKIDSGSYQISWNKTGVDNKYLIKLKVNDQEDFIPIAFIKDTSFVFHGLDTCTSYDISISVYCNQLDIADEKTYTFKTQCSNSTYEESEINEFNIYPNPAKNELYIEPLYITQGYSFEITDIFGKVIYLNKSNVGNCKLYLKNYNLNPGIYFLNIISENKKYNYKVLLCDE